MHKNWKDDCSEYMDSQPFSVVEDEEFRQLINKLELRYTLPLP